MFGSNFQQQFGIVGPPWDTLDNWQGMFGPNTQSPWELPGNDISGVKPQPAGPLQEPALPTAPQGTPQAAGGGAPTFQGLTGSSLGGQPLAPDQNRTATALAPGPLAAGANSEFDRGR